MSRYANVRTTEAHGSGPEPRGTTIDVVAADQTFCDEWLELAGRLPSSYFQTPDWILTWWRHNGRPVTQVYSWRDRHGSLVAVVALTRTRYPLVTRFGWSVPVTSNAGAGAGDADHCGWLVDPIVAPTVRAWTEQTLRRETLLVHGVAAACGDNALPRHAGLLAETVCPRLEIPPTLDELDASGKFCKQLRRYGRRLADSDVTFRWVGPGRVEPGHLATMHHLHTLRRTMKAGTAASGFGDRELALHHALVELRRRDRGPAVVVAEREGMTIGILYGLWWQRTFAYYQLGWHPDWARHNLGTMLVGEAIRLAGARGADVFDFLRGAEPYKYRFGASDAIDRTWYTPRGRSGRLLQLAQAARTVRRRGPTPAVSD